MEKMATLKEIRQAGREAGAAVFSKIAAKIDAALADPSCDEHDITVAGIMSGHWMVREVNSVCQKFREAGATENEIKIYMRGLRQVLDRECKKRSAELEAKVVRR